MLQNDPNAAVTSDSTKEVSMTIAANDAIPNKVVHVPARTTQLAVK